MANITARLDHSPHSASSTQAASYLEVVVFSIAVVAVVYLLLLSRAVALDEQLSDMEQDISQLEGQLVLARQELYVALAPQSLGIDPEADKTCRLPGNAEPVVTPPLPAVEPSVMLSVAGDEPFGFGAAKVARTEGVRTGPQKVARTLTGL